MTSLLDLVLTSQKLRPQTKEVYARAVERFLAFAGADPSRWTPIVVEAWRDSLITEGLSNETANLYLRGLGFATRRSERMGIGSDFARPVESMRAGQAKVPMGLSWAEIDRLVATVSGPMPADLRDRALIVLGLRAGGRRASELANFTWADIQGRIGTFTVKGGHRHAVELDDEALAVLEPWRAFSGNHDGYVFRSLRWTVENSWELGEGLSRKSVWSIVSARGEEAGLRHIHPHMLRHSYITLWLADGVPLPVVMRQAGHKSLDMTSRYIDHARADVVSPTARNILRTE